MKSIKMEEAVKRIIAGEEAYMLMPMTKITMIEELAVAVGFYCKDEAPKAEKPAPAPKQQRVDHGKICACYGAGWSIKDIAEEVGCSEPTVRDYLKKEGLYNTAADKA